MRKSDDPTHDVSRYGVEQDQLIISVRRIRMSAIDSFPRVRHLTPDDLYYTWDSPLAPVSLLYMS